MSMKGYLFWAIVNALACLLWAAGLFANGASVQGVACLFANAAVFGAMVFGLFVARSEAQAVTHE